MGIMMSVMLVVITVGTLEYIWVFQKSRQRVPAEQGKTPLYSVTGSGRIGAHAYSWPFLRVTLYEDFLVMAGCFGVAVLRYGDLAGLRRIWRGFHIVHNKEGEPQRLVFWSGSAAEALRIIEAHLRQDIRQEKPWNFGETVINCYRQWRHNGILGTPYATINVIGNTILNYWRRFRGRHT
jgi:hypothetical protein